MGIVVGVVVLLTCGYLLAAALQQHAIIKPYAGVFALAGLTALAAPAVSASMAEWLLLAAKLLALLGCLVLCVHLAVLVVRRLLGKRNA